MHAISGTKEDTLNLHPDAVPQASTLGSSTKYTWLAVVAFAGLILFGKRLRKKLRVAWIKRNNQRRLGKHRKLAPGVDPAAVEPDWEEQEEEEGAGEEEAEEEAAYSLEDADGDDQMTEEPIAPRALRGREKNTDAAGHLAPWSQKKGRRTRDAKGKRRDRCTAVSVELTDGSEFDVSVDLSSAEDLPALQKLVVEQWVALGGSRQDGLMMMYLDDAGGDFLKVTRSTTIETLKEAPALRLQAKHSAGKPRPVASGRAAPPGRTRGAPE